MQLIPKPFFALPSSRGAVKAAALFIMLLPARLSTFIFNSFCFFRFYLFTLKFAKSLSFYILWINSVLSDRLLLSSLKPEGKF